MYKMQCALALVTLLAELVHSWDIVTGTGNRLDFYTGQNVSHSIEIEHTFNITALAYDEVHDMLLFVDKQNDHACIYSFNISTDKSQSLVTRDNIEGIAYDPVKKIIFWTDSKERSIYWISLEPGSKNDVGGNLLLKMDDEIPMAIAVDSCRGYIYWTNINPAMPTIERALFDGSERKKIIHTDIHKPISLLIDQQTKRIFWTDEKLAELDTVENADLNGEDRDTLMVWVDIRAKPMTVLRNYLYLTTDYFIWRCLKPYCFLDEIASPGIMPSSIAANYTIEDQIEDIDECEPLRSLLKLNSLNKDVLSFPGNVNDVDKKSQCNCTPGYVDDKRDVSVCQNYCFQGICHVNDKGQPNCSCSTGYSGERCEVNVCFNYCLNNGVCSLNEHDGAVCECKGNYEGTRCEVVKEVAIRITATHNLEDRNVTLVDFVSNHRRTTTTFTVTVEVESP